MILSFLPSEVGEERAARPVVVGGGGGSSGWDGKIILDREIFLVGFSGETRYVQVHLHLLGYVYCGFLFYVPEYRYSVCSAPVI